MMIRPNSPNRLLVEGLDDQYAIINLMREHGADWDKPDPWLPYIERCDGWSGVVAKTETGLFKSMERIGIVLDADSDPASRWTSVQGRLRECGLETPTDLPSAGLIENGDIGGKAFRCGVWMMPDNRTDGMLEDFITTLIADGDVLWPHACGSTKAAKDLGAPFNDTHCTKASLHAWLAWQETPGRPIGQAITAKVLGSRSELADRFATWFTRLFQED